MLNMKSLGVLATSYCNWIENFILIMSVSRLLRRGNQAPAMVRAESVPPCGLSDNGRQAPVPDTKNYTAIAPCRAHTGYVGRVLRQKQANSHVAASRESA